MPEHFRSEPTTVRATAQDVADLAGVSRSAVSRAFTPGGSVSDDTREKVLSAARKLRYVPNPAARSLMTKRTNLIAIVVSNQGNAVFDRLLEVFNLRLMDVGYSALLVTAVENSTDEDRFIQLLRYPLDGVVVTAAGTLAFSQNICRQCLDLGIPAVTLNRTLEGFPFSAVNCDHRQGGKLAADLLIDTGLRRLAVIVGHERTTVNIERLGGFLDRVSDRGLAKPVIVRSPLFTFEGGYAAAGQILTDNPDVEGLFCVNDLLAIGAMEAARQEFGLSVPDDLSIVGFDNMPAAAWPSYDITTIRQPIEQMVEETLQILMDEISRQNRIPHNTTIPVELVRRSSTRPAASVM